MIIKQNLELIRSRTIVRDIIDAIKTIKFSWAGHVPRMADFKWTSQVKDRRPQKDERTKSMPYGNLL